MTLVLGASRHIVTVAGVRWEMNGYHQDREAEACCAGKLFRLFLDTIPGSHIVELVEVVDDNWETIMMQTYERYGEGNRAFRDVLRTFPELAMEHLL